MDNLSSQQLKAIHLLVYTDKTNREIAREVGVDKSTVQRWLKTSKFEEKLKEETQRCLNHLASKATRKLEKLIDSRNDGVALGACRTVLDKGGFKETEKIEQVITTIDVSVVED